MPAHPAYFDPAPPAPPHASAAWHWPLAAWLVAVLVAGGSLLGTWDRSALAPSPQLILAAEGLSLALLLATHCRNAHSLGRLARAGTPSHAHGAARLALAAFVLCMAGDIVNANLPQAFHRHSGVVRHDYLADSVWCFAPGYALVLWLGTRHLLRQGMHSTSIGITLSTAALMGLASWWHMHLPGTGTYVSLLTGAYSMLITAVGACGVLLLTSRQPPRPDSTATHHHVTRLCGLGCLLAALADALIGQFWLYGANGQGFYPAVRDVNWIVYIASQSLLTQLAWLGVAPPTH